MPTNKRIDFLITVLTETAKNKLLFINNLYLIEACNLVGWNLSKDNNEVIYVSTKAAGTIIFDLKYLFKKLEQLKLTNEMENGRND